MRNFERVVIVVNGLVVNVALVERGAKWTPPVGELVANAPPAVGPGWRYDGTSFVGPSAAESTDARILDKLDELVARVAALEVK